MIHEKYTGVIDIITGAVPWVKESGLSIVEAQDRHVKLKIPKMKHTNHLGIVYAGSLFMLMEIAGMALMLVTYGDDSYIPINKEMNIKFLNPSFTDMYCDLSITQERAAAMIAPIDEKGKGDWILEMEASDEYDHICAKSCCTYTLRKIGSEINIP